MGKILGGILFWGVIAGLLFVFRPHSFIHRKSVAELTCGQKTAVIILVILVILFVCFLMTLSPIWKGSSPGNVYLHAYEQMTEFMLQGHLDYMGETDPKMLELDNPYDPEERNAAGADFPWDWAYYKGHYYMYFGVVPIILVFLPHRLLFGEVPGTYRVSQLFAGLYIAGLAAFLFWCAKNKFRKITLGEMACLLVAFSLISTVYVAKYPILYQTPVVCGMCLEIWSLFLFSKAVWEERNERSALRLAFFGSFLGALSFGCRPTLALANMLVVPMLIRFLRGKRMTWGLAGRLFWAASPYFLAAAGLMLYNYVRFENPFEFGHSYQLTLADQTKLGSTIDIGKVITGILQQLFAFPGIDGNFPFVRLGTGILISCPLLLFAFIWIKKDKQPDLRKQDLFTFRVLIPVIILLIIAIHYIKTPGVWDRYRSDYLWLMCLGAWLGIGEWNERRKKLECTSSFLCTAALLCVALTSAIFLIPDDGSFTECYPEINRSLWSIMTFGLAG